MDRHNVPFPTDHLPAFSSTGSILLADKSKQNLYLYELREGKYCQVWMKTMPPGMRDGSYKAARSTGEILMQRDTDADTVEFSRDLQRRETYQREGRLVGCTDDGHVLYRRGTWYERDWWIEVWDGQGLVMTLRHPAAQGRVSQRRDGGEDDLSTCTVGDNIVVVEHCSDSLDIYTKQGI